MRKIVITIIMLVSLATILFIGSCTSSVTSAGSEAPDFTLVNLDGEFISLSDFRGTPVVVNFWATWCGYCRYEMPYFQQIDDEWPDSELIVLMIDVGEHASKVEEYLRTYNLSLNVLLDRQRTVSRTYNIVGYPTTLFIDKDGIIREKVSGAFRDKESIENYLDEIIYMP